MNFICLSYFDPKKYILKPKFLFFLTYTYVMFYFLVRTMMWRNYNYGLEKLPSRVGYCSKTEEFCYCQKLPGCPYIWKLTMFQCFLYLLQIFGFKKTYLLQTFWQKSSTSCSWNLITKILHLQIIQMPYFETVICEWIVNHNIWYLTKPTLVHQPADKSSLAFTFPLGTSISQSANRYSCPQGTVLHFSPQKFTSFTDKYSAHGEI